MITPITKSSVIDEVLQALMQVFASDGVLPLQFAKQDFAVVNWFLQSNE